MEHLKCSHCKLVKPSDRFTPIPTRTRGYGYTCKCCRAEIRRVRYHSDQEFRTKVNDSSMASRARQRERKERLLFQRLKANYEPSTTKD